MQGRRHTLSRALRAAHAVSSRQQRLHYLALIRREEGRLDEARRLAEEALDCARPVGHTWRTATSLHELGLILLLQGDLTGVRERLEESLALCRAADDRNEAAKAAMTLGRVARREGAREEARARFEAGLRSVAEAGNPAWVVAGALEGFAALARDGGSWARAAGLYGAADARWAQSGDWRPAYDRQECERAARELRRDMGEEAFAAAWEAGQAMSLEEAVEDALAGPEDTGPAT